MKRAVFLKLLKYQLLNAPPGERICVVSPTPDAQKQLLADLAEEIKGSRADFTTISVFDNRSGKPFDYGKLPDHIICDDVCPPLTKEEWRQLPWPIELPNEQTREGKGPPPPEDGPHRPGDRQAHE